MCYDYKQTYLWDERLTMDGQYWYNHVEQEPSPIVTVRHGCQQ
jgi:hypothetical protein